MIALTSSISVELISAANWVFRVELVAVSIFHVEAQNTDTLTENVVVDLVRWAAYSAYLSYWGRSIGAIWDKLVRMPLYSVSEVHGWFLAGAHDVLEGLSVDLVDVAACLRVKQYKQ